LDDIIFRMLAKSPEDRPFNARQVQAVMLKLGEELIADHPEMTGGLDVPADRVPEVGRYLLEKQIAGAHEGTNVSWAKLAVVAVVLVVLIATAAVMGK
jgi:hypothetical protein